MLLASDAVVVVVVAVAAAVAMAVFVALSWGIDTGCSPQHLYLIRLLFKACKGFFANQMGK